MGEKNRGARALLLGLSLAVVALTAARESRAEESLAAFQYEITPLAGINLPYDLWATSGNFTVLGGRFGYNMTPLGISGVLVAGGLYQYSGAEKIYTFDLSYRYDFVAEGMNAFFTFGFHSSKFSLEPKVNEDGTYAVPDGNGGGKTDSGQHGGLIIGGGILIPIKPNIPLEFGMRFYNNPQLWLLLEMGVSFRF